MNFKYFKQLSEYKQLSKQEQFLKQFFQKALHPTTFKLNIFTRSLEQKGPLL